MTIRDRIKELRRIPARELRPNPKNWRTHPPAQQDALRGVLAEIGYAGALLARELDDGSLELIDGHLRAETTPDMLVPVLVLDLTSEEADKLLATHDPVGAMAGVDIEALEALTAAFTIESPAVDSMLRDLATFASACTPSSAMGATGSASASGTAENPKESNKLKPPREIKLPMLFQIVIECLDENQQRELYERLTAEGLKCRVLTL